MLLSMRGPFLKDVICGKAALRFSPVLHSPASILRPPHRCNGSSTEKSREGNVKSADGFKAILAITHKVPKSLGPFTFLKNDKARRGRRGNHATKDILDSAGAGVQKNPTESQDARNQAKSEARAQMKVYGRDTKVKVKTLLLMSVACNLDRESTAWDSEEERVLGALYVLIVATEALLEHHLKLIHDKTTPPTPREQQMANDLDKELFRLKKLRYMLKSYMRTMMRWEKRGKCEMEREKILQELTLRLEEEADKMEGGKIDRWKNFRAFIRSFKEMFSIWYSGKS